MINITFQLLTEAHFPLLLKWLEAPHVKAWWDADMITWTPAQIEQKYGNYVKGFKLEKGNPKAMQALIIAIDDQLIGYIQVYNAYDFPRSSVLIGLPSSLGAFDILIGEKEYLGKGFGSKILKLFLEKICDAQYDHMFVDPESENIAAIKTYEKVGFQKIKDRLGSGEIWMLRTKKHD